MIQIFQNTPIAKATYKEALTEIKIKIEEVKRRFALASLTEIITPSDKRQRANCENYEKCGGCQLRHIKYEEQLKIKKNIVENAFIITAARLSGVVYFGSLCQKGASP